MIYHITSRRAWNEAQTQGVYRAESLDSEGFIHCSTEDQVIPVTLRFYKGRTDLLLLVIDPERLTSDLKWEPPDGGTPPPGVPEENSFHMCTVPSTWMQSLKFSTCSRTRTESS